jgi:hypothetical protein
MTDAEADFGITHNDHFDTEEWRVQQVARIKAGIPNTLPPELNTGRQKSRSLPFAGALVIWVSVNVGLVVLILVHH